MIGLSELLDLLFQFLMALVSMVAFAFIFHAPKKEILFIGLTGALGWLTFMIATFFGMTTVWASFIAAIVITWVSRTLSYKRQEPITTFLICGIFPIVPGAGIYYTGYYFFMGQNALGMSKGFETLKIAIAIAIGISIISTLPYILFSHRKIENKKSSNSKPGDNK